MSELALAPAASPSLRLARALAAAIVPLAALGGGRGAMAAGYLRHLRG